MIGAFESMMRQCPQRTCFTYVDEAGNETAYSYREARMLSAALARLLLERGVRPGDCVAVDLPNCPEYVLLMLAAAYGGFALVTLNNRLTDAEKYSRLLDIERKPDVSLASLRIDETNASRLVDGAQALLAGENALGAQGSARASQRGVRPSFAARVNAASAEARTTKALGRASSGRASLRRRSEMAQQDAAESVIHFAEHASHVFDFDARAVVMFTSGTTGRAKAVSLTWGNICFASEASNRALNRQGEGLWQAVLPLYHIGGFQVIVRSVLNCCPFVLYRRFDAARLLSDAAKKGATHVSVVDKMLQDMLVVDKPETLARYSCILLGGGALNPQTLDRACRAGARVYASYGMTETSSQIAHAQVTASFTGGLRLLPGYEAHIVDPGDDGFGRLAVKGPGLFGGYLNARAAYTVDGFFLTGDTAALYGGKLFVKERTEDMFVSGGENVYPAEIKEKLLRVAGVADAHVFGAPDARWGRRPVAFVEREKVPAPRPTTSRFNQREQANPRATMTNRQLATTIRASLAPRLSKLYLPKHVCVVDEFPRSGIGKVDRAALEQLYDQRIEVARVTLHRIRLPFKTPFKTAKATLTHRESVIVEVTDHAGRTGLGECVAFPTDWYLPEVLDQDVRVLHDLLAPLVLHEAFLHPREVSAAFASLPEAQAFPLACGALEPALWDLYGKIVGKPLRQLIGGEVGAAGAGAPAGAPGGASTSVPAGAVIGLGSAVETAAAARRCAEAGYKRVKLKVKPGGALACAQAVRAALPDMMITLDANQSFSEREAEELRGLDNLNVAWIEEPLDPRRLPAVGPTDLFSRLSRLQRALRTPICLDESIVRPDDLSRALAHPELRCYALKLGKCGGVQPALDFVRLAQARGIDVWMGGMYDTGVSKRLHAAFETLHAVRAPGDIGDTARYFSCDITDPPHTAERGMVTLNREGHAAGLGCDLNRSALENVLVERIVIT
ncbi:o-succinylbenzoate synthase [Eggerthella timonensis]|uniref:o-succinylbenzoate synthase n=1 Tax=Eggerthella timonensis TaxID=1871008 RepID=UPI000C787D7E|nr:o-succinylbenzoate synthase [Eggerthella timonensis]